ncbi:MAG: TolC family protein [Muribaculaceae bacterium]
MILNRKHTFAALLAIAVVMPLKAQLTIGYCIERARENYPLINKCGLIDKTAELNLSDINKTWLPSIGLYGQGTWQSAVPSFPSALTDMMAGFGQNFEGLGKWQYQVGAEVNQTIWDGGNSSTRRGVERAGAAANRAATEVQLYEVTERVENLFFGILLLQEQIAQTEAKMDLIKGNIDRLQAMVEHGTARQSDVNILQAEYLSASQQLVQAGSAIKGYRAVLEVFMGESLGDQSLIEPDAFMPADMTSARPELDLFNTRLSLNEWQRRAIDDSLKPTVGFFARAYYGYPGYDYFKSMTERDPSFNFTLGVKVSWTITPFYTRDNRRILNELNAMDIETDREVFLHNNNMQRVQVLEEISGMQQVSEQDDRIVALRTQVRQDAENQLIGGIIDTTDLLAKITDEHTACLLAKYHHVQLIQLIYKLKYTLNR